MSLSKKELTKVDEIEERWGDVDVKPYCDYCMRSALQHWRRNGDCQYGAVGIHWDEDDVYEAFVHSGADVTFLINLVDKLRIKNKKITKKNKFLETEKQNRKLRKKNSKISKNLKKKKIKMKDVEDKNSTMEESMNKIQDEIHKNHEEKTRMETVMRTENNKKDKLKQELESTKKIKDKLDEDLVSMRKRKDNVRRELKETQKFLNHAIDDFSTQLEAVNGEYQKKIDFLSEKIEGEKKNQQTIDMLSEKIDVLSEKVLVVSEKKEVLVISEEHQKRIDMLSEKVLVEKKEKKVVVKNEKEDILNLRPEGWICKSHYDVGGCVKVVPIDGYSDMFREINHGFILKQLPNEESFVVVYVKENVFNGTIRELSSKEKDIAHKMGFSVIKKYSDKKGWQ